MELCVAFSVGITSMTENWKLLLKSIKPKLLSPWDWVKSIIHGNLLRKKLSSSKSIRDARRSQTLPLSVHYLKKLIIQSFILTPCFIHGRTQRSSEFGQHLFHELHSTGSLKSTSSQRFLLVGSSYLSVPRRTESLSGLRNLSPIPRGMSSKKQESSFPVRNLFSDS